MKALQLPAGFQRQLQLPVTSPWPLSAALNDNNSSSRESHSNEVPTGTGHISLFISSSPVRMNISPENFSLLLDSIKSAGNEFKAVKPHDQFSPPQKKDRSVEGSGSSSTNPLACIVSFDLPLFEIKLFREERSGLGRPIANQRVLLSIQSIEANVTKHLGSIVNSLDIGRIAIFDLSSHKSICLLGPQMSTDTGSTILKRFDSMESGGHSDDGNLLEQQLSVDLSVHPKEKVTLSVCLGRTQFVVLPSLIKSLMEFQATLKDKSPSSRRRVEREEKRDKANMLQDLSFPFSVSLIELSVNITGFDLLLSSRDLHKTRGSNPIGVVSFRWKTKLTGSLFFNTATLKNPTPFGSDINFIKSFCDAADVNQEAVRLWKEFFIHHNEGIGTTFEGQLNDNYCYDGPLMNRILVAKLGLEVQDLQARRTCIKKLPSSDLNAIGMDSSSCIFATSPPPSGEQQMIFPFNFRLQNTVSAASFARFLPDMVDSLTVEDYSGCEQQSHLHHSEMFIFHTAQLDVDLIDVLVYARQSSEGLHEALRVSVDPIIKMFKGKEHHNLTPRKSEQKVSAQTTTPRKNSQPESQTVSRMENAKGKKGSGKIRSNSSSALPITSPIQNSDSIIINGENSASLFLPKSSFHEVVRHTNSVVSIQVDGIQLTCVPGGATRLNESPIIKAACTSISGGLAVSPIPQEIQTPPKNEQTTLQERSAVLMYKQKMAHMNIESWLICDVSAHYHNRRLVAWEPAVEPWTMHFGLGIDLTRALNMLPFPWYDSRTVESQPVPLFPRAQNKLHDRAGEKIRDLGRILRSVPGVGSHIDTSVLFKSSEEASTTRPLSPPHYSEICHLLQYMIGSECLHMAQYPHATISEKGIKLRNGFESEWTELHCLPDKTLSAKKNSVRVSPAISLCLSATKPLNVNLSGALIENVANFLSHEINSTDSETTPLAPHWIRNDTGVSIRFKEELDAERVRRGDQSKYFLLANGCETTLSLKRGIAQTCDPHRAFISLEMGDNLVDEDENCPSSTKDNSNFFVGRASFKYKAVGRIPVDMVGVYKFPLYRVDDDRLTAKGASSSVIVRVALSGGTKIVSIESPLFLKNVTNTPILCQVKAQPSGSLLWETTLFSESRETRQSKGVGSESEREGAPIPVHFVPFVNSDMLSLSLIALPACPITDKRADGQKKNHVDSTTFPFPPSFSKNSTKRGLIRVSEISLERISAEEKQLEPTIQNHRKFFHLNVCSLRIGNFSLEPQIISKTDQSHPLIPEQRMLLFRPPITIRNHLPRPISIQIRVKNVSFVLSKMNSSRGSKLNLSGENMFTLSSSKGSFRQNLSAALDWEDIGTVQCGAAAEWSGATATDSVEVRVRLKDDFGGKEESKEFPTWSTPVTLPPEGTISRLGGSEYPRKSFTEKLIVADSFGVELPLSIALEKSNSAAGDSDSSPHQNIRTYANDMASAPRALAIFCPFWIVDASGLDLEYKTRTPVAGQSLQEKRIEGEMISHEVNVGVDVEEKNEKDIFDYGLADLLKDEDFAYLEARSPFDILMIGDEKAGELCIRQRQTKHFMDGEVQKDDFSPWSKPITIQRNLEQRISVLPISSGSKTSAGHLYLALNTRTISAPKEFGGLYGTKLVHVVSRYAFVNLLDREIDINTSEKSKQSPVTVGVDGKLQPLHFDDAGLIRIRPKEFGWGWSGPFSLTKKRRDLTLRLLNKLTGSAIIAEIEFEKRPKSNQTIITLRPSRHPPFRLENHTVHPLQFRQISHLTDEESTSSSAQTGTVLLPYHNAKYAWDRPDAGPRLILIEVSDFGTKNDIPNHVGIFDLDHIAPGTKLNVGNPVFSADIMADGPTRVLRVNDSSLQARHLVEIEEEEQGWNTLINISKSFRLPLHIQFKLTAGIGISIVDWTPQELLYVRLNDISIDRSVFSGLEEVKMTIGSISVDNQLWITPYPVLLKVGDEPISKHGMRIRRRRHKQNAFSISWCRELDTRGSHGGLSLLKTFDFSCENLFLKVDGNLFDLLWNMLSSAIEIDQVNGVGTESKFSLNRDNQLRMIFGSDHHLLHTSNDANQVTSTPEAFESTMITAAIAAKMGSKKQVENDFLQSDRNRRNLAASREEKALDNLSKKNDDTSVAVLSKPRHKYYIEKIRISQLGIELSWSGNLPAAIFALPGFMRPALTFEGIPIMLRPFTDGHAYGTVQDHLQNVTSHYLSIRRIIDVIAGLFFKPSLLVRACLFTSREFIATYFAGVSDMFASAGSRLSKLSSTKQLKSFVEMEDNLLDEDYSLVQVSTMVSPKHFGSKVLGKAGALLQILATLNSTISSSFRYEGGKKIFGLARNKGEVVESIRLRPPRLFENQEGKDLLVEYVEGENVGKALLSRVRMGVYLAEGYIFHGDCALVESDLISNPLVFLLTSERLLLLWKGGGNLNFASVVWEVTFNDIVLVSGEGVEGGSKVNMIELWFLLKEHGTSDGQDTFPDRNATLPCQGLETMHCQKVYFHWEDSMKILDEILLSAPSTKTEHFKWAGR